MIVKIFEKDNLITSFPFEENLITDVVKDKKIKLVEAINNGIVNARASLGLDYIIMVGMLKFISAIIEYPQVHRDFYILLES